MCYLTGLFGYLSFRDAVDGDILSNLPGFCGRVFKFFVACHLVCYIPGEVGKIASCRFPHFLLDCGFDGFTRNFACSKP